MIPAIVLLFCLLLPSTGLALNVTPESNHAVGWWPLVLATSSEEATDWRATHDDQLYQSNSRDDYGFSSSPNCRLPVLCDMMSDYGDLATFYLRTWEIICQGRHGLAFTFYAYDASGWTSASEDLEELQVSHGFVPEQDAGIWVVEVPPWGNAFAMVVFPSGIERLYRGLNGMASSSLVYANSGDGLHYAASWGAYTVVAYNGYYSSESAAVLHARTFWQRMDGFEGVERRPVEYAVTGLDNLTYLGPGSFVLAPTVLEYWPPAGYLDPTAGFYRCTALFDTAMYPWGPLLYCDDGYTSTGMFGTPHMPRFETENYLVGFAIPLRCPGSVRAYVNAQSAVGRHPMVGGRAGSPWLGMGPARRLDFSFSTTATKEECENYSTQFSRMGAFPQGGRTCIYWRVEFERGTEGYEIFGGTKDQPDRLLATMPVGRRGAGKRPAAYFLTLPADCAVFRVVERDSTGGRTFSRPFRTGEKPPDFEEIMAAVGAPEPRPLSSDTPHDSGSGCAGKSGLTTRPQLIFVSSRQDFLDACQPVIEKYWEFNLSTQTLLTSNDPWDVRGALQDYY